MVEEINPIRGPGEQKEKKSGADSKRFRELMKVQKTSEVELEKRRKRKFKTEEDSTEETKQKQPSPYETSFYDKKPSPLNTTLDNKKETVEYQHPSSELMSNTVHPKNIHSEMMDNKEKKTEEKEDKKTPTKPIMVGKKDKQTGLFTEDKSPTKPIMFGKKDKQTSFFTEDKSPTKDSPLVFKNEKKLKENGQLYTKKEEEAFPSPKPEKKELEKEKEKPPFFIYEEKKNEKEFFKRSEKTESSHFSKQTKHDEEKIPSALEGLETKEKKLFTEDKEKQYKDRAKIDFEKSEKRKKEEFIRKEHVNKAITIEQNISQLPHDIAAQAAALTSEVASYHSPQVQQLFQQMVGSMIYISREGIEKTEITLNQPSFASSTFFGTKISFEKYSTAPDSYNIRLTGSNQAVTTFNENIDGLYQSFRKGNFSFRVGRLYAEYQAERPLFKRKPGVGKEDKY